MRRSSNHFAGPIRTRPRRRRTRPLTKRPVTRPRLSRNVGRPKRTVTRDAETQIRAKADALKTVSSIFDKGQDERRGETSKSDSSANSVCEVIELLMFNEESASLDGAEGSCNLTSNSFEDQNDPLDVCNSCSDCVHCLGQRETLTDNEAGPNHVTTDNFPSFENFNRSDQNGKYTTTSSATVSATKLDEEPILVDLTNDETKVALEQTLLTRHCDIEDVTEIFDVSDTANRDKRSESDLRESQIMIADSSSRLYRGNTGSSLATALRDRGPYVIPMQPNRSLPIRPAPPVPTRATTIAKFRKDYASVLTLSKELSVHVVEVDPSKPTALSSDTASNEENGFGCNEQMTKDDCKILSVDSFLPNDPSNGARLSNLKRKVSEGRDKEIAGDVGKDTKKRRKSCEADLSQGREERVDGAFKEFSKNSSDNMIDKGNRIAQHGTMDPWVEKRCAMPATASTTQDFAGKNKDISNKVVPPLRLKKIVREGLSDGYRSAQMMTGIENESNYRIVTGATPCPDSLPPSMSNMSSWASAALNENGQNVASGSQPSHDGLPRHSSPMTDGYKLKYRRNRLRQKLRELRGKALDLGQQMANSSGDSSPQRITRLGQIMNCYEKQIENLSKLLNTLSNASPSEDVIDLEEDNERDYYETTCDVADDEHENDGSGRSHSPFLSSPEPPKLLPRSPIDCNENRSPCEIRDSPPILPRVSLTLPPALESGKDRSSQSERNVWNEDDTAKGKPVLSASVDKPNMDSQLQTSAGAIGERKKSTPSVPPATSDDRGRESEIVDIDIDKSCLADVKNPATLTSSKRTLLSADNNVANQAIWEKRESKEQPKSDDLLCPSPVKNGGVADAETRSQFNPVGGPIVSSISGGLAVPKAVRCGDPVYGPIVPTATRIQAPSAMNILQLQPNYYPSVMPNNNMMPGGMAENSRPTHKVTSSSNHCGSMECASASLPLNQIGLSAGVTDNQCNMSSSNNGETVKANSSQRNDNTRIMADQFPTLGNWVARMSKKHVTKSKSTLQTTVAASHNASEDNIRAAQVSVAGGQKMIATNHATSVPRSNIVNVAPQWNSQRWQRLQHQQQRQQQQLLQQVAAAAAPSTTLPPPPPSRPGFCPPIPVTQLYPNNYSLDPYGGAAFSYHSAMYPYASYPYHPRLHSGPPLGSYQIPIQEPLSTQLRSLPHVDNKRLPSLQDPTRHFATDILKYPGPLPTGAFQHPNSFDYDRLRTATAAQGGGLSPLLLPPPRPALQNATPSSLPQTSPSAYSNASNQFGRRMIPDVVAAAAAAAVVAAASFGRRRDPLSPYSRADTDNAASAAVADIVATEAPRLSSNNRSNNSSREHVAATQQTPLMGSGSLNRSNEELRLNAASYNPLQNLLLDGLPFIRSKSNYGQAPMFPNNVQVSTSSTIASTTSSRIQMGKADAGRNETARYCETPHLGKVNRSPDTVSNIMCSNCGLPGSMFKCLGCEAAFYCDERCQARHWIVHGEKCPKKMPKLKKVA